MWAPHSGWNLDQLTIRRLECFCFVCYIDIFVFISRCIWGWRSNFMLVTIINSLAVLVSGNFGRCDRHGGQLVEVSWHERLSCVNFVWPNKLVRESNVKVAICRRTRRYNNTTKKQHLVISSSGGCLATDSLIVDPLLQKSRKALVIFYVYPTPLRTFVCGIQPVVLRLAYSIGFPRFSTRTLQHWRRILLFSGGATVTSMKKLNRFSRFLTCYICFCASGVGVPPLQAETAVCTFHPRFQCIECIFAH